MGPDTWWIIKYSGLSDSACSDLCWYRYVRYFLVIVKRLSFFNYHKPSHAFATLQLLPLSSLLIILSLRVIVSVTCFFLPAVPCLLILGCFESVMIACWAL